MLAIAHELDRPDDHRGMFRRSRHVQRAQLDSLRGRWCLPSRQGDRLFEDVSGRLVEL